MSETNGTAKYPGEAVKLGDREYIVPSLSVRQAKKLWPKILKINEGITAQNLPEMYDSILETIHSALIRNYPDFKLEELEDLVDMKNIRQLQLVVMGQSGLKVVPGAEPAVGSPVK